MAQYLPKLRHQTENSGRRGEGRVSSLNIQLLEVNLYPRNIREVFRIAQCSKEMVPI
jgi:hypothetical protein